MADPLDSIRDELARLSDAGLRRRLRPVDGPQAAEVIVDGRRAINFSSNNYLGLADHPALVEAARRAMDEAGLGAGASRLIVGNLARHRALEVKVARWQGTEAALLFNSGYHANVGILSALAGPDDVIFSDALNHASIIDGCRLSRARVEVYAHRDTEDLARRLGKIEARRRIIVTDSIFSMDGDRAPLEPIRALAPDALLIVDDAHAIGVLGDDGVGLGRVAHLKMGTFGKALGAFGAFVAGPQPLIELLLNRARSFVFTTALPVPVVAAAEAAIDWLATDEGRAARTGLQEHANRLHLALREIGLSTAPSHIVPLRVKDGDPRRAMEAADTLLARGIYAQGIRPPTVPPGTARLRVSLMATHSEAHLAALIAAVRELRPLFA